MDMQKRVAEMVEIIWKVAHEADNQRDWEWRWNHMSTTLSGMHSGVNYFGGLDRDEWREFVDATRLLRQVAFEHYMRGWKE